MAKASASVPLEIAFASDANYFPALAVALLTVLENTPYLEGSVIHVLDGGLTDSQVALLKSKTVERASGVRLEFHKLKPDQFKGVRLLAGSAMTYARLLLPDLFPQSRAILYIDVDVCYFADLRDLWSTDITMHAVAAVPDSVVKVLGQDCAWIEQGSADASKPYFNAGVLKINLDYWRRHRIDELAIALAQSEPQNCKFWDQTVLNYLLKDVVCWVPDKFNTAEPVFAARAMNPAGSNIHFITQRKPWTQYSTRFAFRAWRAVYARTVSRMPAYKFHFSYWSRFEWRELVVGTWMHGPACQLLLGCQIYRVLPSLSEEILRMELRRARELREVKRSRKQPQP